MNEEGRPRQGGPSTADDPYAEATNTLTAWLRSPGITTRRRQTWRLRAPMFPYRSKRPWSGFVYVPHDEELTAAWRAFVQVHGGDKEAALGALVLMVVEHVLPTLDDAA